MQYRMIEKEERVREDIENGWSKQSGRRWGSKRNKKKGERKISSIKGGRGYVIIGAISMTSTGTAREGNAETPLRMIRRLRSQLSPPPLSLSLPSALPPPSLPPLPLSRPSSLSQHAWRCLIRGRSEHLPEHGDERLQRRDFQDSVKSKSFLGGTVFLKCVVKIVSLKYFKLL